MFLIPWIVFVGILGFQSLSKHYERRCSNMSVRKYFPRLHVGTYIQAKCPTAAAQYFMTKEHVCKKDAQPTNGNFPIAG